MGQQIKEKTQTSIISKKTSVYLSAVCLIAFSFTLGHEGIAKYVLEMAGEGKDEYFLPESKCIKVEDVEVRFD